MTSLPHRTLLAVLLAALVLLAACGGRKLTRSYQDADMDFGSVRTVAVLPLANLTREQSAGDRVRDVFQTLLLATGAVYVVPQGEVARALERVGVANPVAPTVEEVTKLGTALKADAVITGTVKEYGELRSGSTAANAISISMQMQEAGTGKVVWAGASTKGGIGVSDRLFGGGGEPLNRITEEAVGDLLDQLFR